MALTALPRTATTLHCHLVCEGEEVGAGQITFDLFELPGLVTSYRLGTSQRRADLDMRGADGAGIGPLTARERARAQALAVAIVHPGRCVPPLDADSHERGLQQIAGMPASAQQVYRIGLTLLGLTARLRTGRRFENLGVVKRRELVSWIGGSGIGGRALMLILGAPLKNGHYGSSAYAAAIGMDDYRVEILDSSVGGKRPREKPARWTQNILTPDQLDPDTTLEADVVVIGTGAGGAVVAAELAERGLGVALIEEGVHAERSDFSGPLMDRTRRFYRKAGLMFSVGNATIAIPTGKVVGGSTAMNSGTCFRAPDSVMAEWRARGFPEEFSAEGFDGWFRSVENILGVEDAAAEHLGVIASIVAKGAEAMGGNHHPLPRNAPGCDGQGVCPFGCPTDAKRSTNVSYVPRALRAGASCFTAMPVTRIHMRGRRAVAVEARGFSRSGERRVLRIRARAVVVACGTLQSPLLLGASGVRLPHIGRHLSIHPALAAFVRCSEDVAGWNAIPQSYGVTGLTDPRIRFEGFYLPPQLSGGLLPLQGQQLTEWMDDQRRVGQYGLMVRDRNVGRVMRGPGGAPLIYYNLTPDVLDLMRRGTATLVEMLLRGGGREVVTQLAGIGVISSIDDARRIASRPLKPRDVTCSAYHPLGTNRMGASEAEGVVDFDHRVFRTDNLYVVDGSSVPSSLGVNPQITIMAMATRAAAHLADKLGA